MSSIQKHIINKLQVDVVANNSATAFDLKDNIDGFLKQDILPFLENYFSTLEDDLHSQVIQIPYLSVDVDTSSKLNYRELKEDVKRALTKEVKRMTSLAHPMNEEAKLITQESSKESTFLHFLETGTSPWWMKSEEIFELTEEEFAEMLASKSFLMKFQTKLINSEFRNRIIQQLSNQQLSIALKAIDAQRFEKIWQKKYDITLEMLKPEDRKTLWDCIIDDVLQKDIELFTARLIFHLTQKLSEASIENDILSKENQSFLTVVIGILNTVTSNSEVQKAIKTVSSLVRNPVQPVQRDEERFLNVETSSNKDQEVTKSDTNKETTKLEKDDIETRTIETSMDISEHKIDASTKEEVINTPKDSLERIQEQQIVSEDTTSKKNTLKKEKNPSNSIRKRAKIKKNKSSNQESKKIEEKTEAQSIAEANESLKTLLKKEDRLLFEALADAEHQQHQKIHTDLYINNAGLILLHPYLKDFFKHCELLDDQNQITNKHLAVHLLHYLATKQEQQFENNMLFEKVLCGIPIEESIQRTIPLSDALKANAEELLEAVLTNWGVLKNASTDLLRGEFLQRFGKISFKEVNPKITVERKVQDILLDRLPWNIGISRLPWLDHLLFTDW